MSRLAMHRAIVTGAGAGIGRAIAIRLAQEGARVVVNDVSLSAARETVAMILADDGIALAVEGDVSTTEGIERAFLQCEGAWDHCSLLVNNAGIVQQIPFRKMEPADWDRMIAVHLRGCFLGCRRAIDPMLNRGAGIIVNIASQLGQIGGTDLAHYSAAKAGIIGLTKALAREFSDKGIRVNAVAPGPVNTELVRTLSTDWREAKAAQLPLGRFGEPEDVAATVAFLSSPEAKTYVGQTLGPNCGDVML